ncbi:MAG: hypothetical protein JWN40_1789 [Phycisphaerales bacterium]|nr:hypothetical protein [Phycisphaerales bacterium]
MRRVLRILFNVATVVSLVLCVVTMAAWVLSYQARDFFSWTQADRRLRLVAETHRHGLAAGVFVPVGTGGRLLPPEARWKYTAPKSYAQTVGSQGTFFKRFGFVFEYSENGAFALRQLACPYWFIMLLTTILPAARLAAWRRRARRLSLHPTVCRHCGYDLRATPDRCPECGTVLKAKGG